MFAAVRDFIIFQGGARPQERAREAGVNLRETQRGLPRAFGLDGEIGAGRTVARAEDDDAARDCVRGSCEPREDRARDGA